MKLSFGVILRLLILVGLVLLTGCVAVPAAAPAVVPAVAPIVHAIAEGVILIIIAALNAGSAPPPDPCDLAEAAFQVLKAVDTMFVQHSNPLVTGYELSVLESWGQVQTKVGPDSIVGSKPVSLKQLVDWIGACPTKHTVTEHETISHEKFWRIK